MTEREKLQACYELAFFPPRLIEAWDQIKRNAPADMDELGCLLDAAELLHQALPEKGFSSQRALTRLALYQAKARAFGMVGFIRRLRQRINRPPLMASEVPGHMVRDIGLPPFGRLA
ncbi:MAG: hypothetical protein WCL16_12305 [bacterium]